MRILNIVIVTAILLILVAQQPYDTKWKVAEVANCEAATHRISVRVDREYD